MPSLMVVHELGQDTIGIKVVLQGIFRRRQVVAVSLPRAEPSVDVAEDTFPFDEAKQEQLILSIAELFVKVASGADFRAAEQDRHRNDAPGDHFAKQIWVGELPEIVAHMTPFDGLKPWMIQISCDHLSIGINDITVTETGNPLRMRFHAADSLFEKRRVNDVIRIQESNQIPLRTPHPNITRGSNTPVRLSLQHHVERRLPLEGFDLFRGVILGSIIDDDHFIGRPRLFCDTRQRTNDVFAGVVRSDH